MNWELLRLKNPSARKAAVAIGGGAVVAAAIGLTTAHSASAPKAPVIKSMTAPSTRAKSIDAYAQTTKVDPAWSNLGPESYRSAVMLKAREEFEQEQGYHFDKIIRGNKQKKLVALTFDDGPHGEYTVKLLQVLRETRTPATFFLVGKMVDKYPSLVQQEVMQGDEVGNHTYDHVDLTQIPPELIGFELDECDLAIKRATGVSPRFFRPPGGDYNVNVIREATRRNYVTTLWTDDPGDYAKPGADVVLQRTLDRLENGAVILLHDGIPETVNILPALIAEARKRGYEFVTLSELAKQR